MINDYKTHTTANDYFLERRGKQQFELFLNAIDEQLKHRFYSNPSVHKRIESLKNKILLQPFTEARKLLDDFNH